MAVAVAGLVLGAALIRWGAGALGLSIALLWGAWIAVLALVGQALRLADPRPAMRRWTGVLGAVGTTVSWFGLVSARFLQS